MWVNLPDPDSLPAASTEGRRGPPHSSQEGAPRPRPPHQETGGLLQIHPGQDYPRKDQQEKGQLTLSQLCLTQSMKIDNH